MNKKLILTIGTITSAIAPVAAVVACGTTSTSNDGKTQGTGNATSNTGNSSDKVDINSNKYFDDGNYRSKRPMNQYIWNLNELSSDFNGEYRYGNHGFDFHKLPTWTVKDNGNHNNDGYYLQGNGSDSYIMNFYKAYDMLVKTYPSKYKYININ